MTNFSVPSPCWRIARQTEICQTWSSVSQATVHDQTAQHQRMTDNHVSTSSLNSLQAGCCSWHPANSVKAPKAVTTNTTPQQNHFTALFLGPPGWAGARRELLDFMVQGKINRGRHTDHPAGRHSIRTNQCPPPPSPIFTGRMPFLPPNQQCQSTEGSHQLGKFTGGKIF